MTRSLLFALLVFSIAACSPKANLNDLSNKDYLSQLIKLKQRTGDLGKDPMIIFNGNATRYQDLKKQARSIELSDVQKIEVVSSKSPIAKAEYGLEGAQGIVLLSTKTDFISPFFQSSKSDVLFMIDGKPASGKKFRKLNPNQIASISVVKNKESIRQYTSRPVDGVVLVQTK